MSRERIVVAGAGAWGTTLALLALRAGHDVTLWTRDHQDAAYMTEWRRHRRSLVGVTFPEELRITSDEVAAFASATAVIVAIPTQSLHAFVSDKQDLLANRLIVSASKGITLDSLALPADVMMAALAGRTETAVAALSGPNLATEIAQGKPAASVVAHADSSVAQRAQRLLHSSTFRVYTSDDPIGVQVGGALKNVIAIASGIAEGLEVGDNAKASLMARGMAEIARLGELMGANRSTFNGLSGIGDLMATCMSRLSRNYRVGLALAEGLSLEDIQSKERETAEGIATTRSALLLAESLKVELPIAAEVAHVLFEGADPRDAIGRLMGRNATGE